MTPMILAGSSNVPLATAIAARLGTRLIARCLDRFPDAELHVVLRESVRDQDLFIVQPTCPPADQHLMELLFLADACRRAGAARVTAVVPYFAYARQDTRADGDVPIGARVVAEIIEAVGIDRLITMDLSGRNRDRHRAGREARSVRDISDAASAPGRWRCG